MVLCPRWYEFLAAVLLPTRVFRQVTLLPVFQTIFVLSCLDQSKVKPSLNRPLGLHNVEAPRISRHENRKIVSPKYWLLGFFTLSANEAALRPTQPPVQCVFNTRLVSTHYTLNYAIHGAFLRMVLLTDVSTRVGTLIMATIYLQLIQNRYMFRSFTLLRCSHQHCVQPVASDVEVVGYL